MHCTEPDLLPAGAGLQPEYLSDDVAARIPLGGRCGDGSVAATLASLRVASVEALRLSYGLRRDGLAALHASAGLRALSVSGHLELDNKLRLLELGDGAEDLADEHRGRGVLAEVLRAVHRHKLQTVAPEQLVAC